MGAGKCASQAGHAYLGSFLAADSVRQRQYHQDGIGTKVCLRVSSLEKLERIFGVARSRGIPCVLIEDAGRNTCFNGVPTITAVGIGPIKKSELPELRKLQLLS